jgi:2-keto-4-pentenoate hydratase
VTDVERAVDDIWRAAERGVYYPAEWQGRLSTAQAYRVQLDILERHRGAGEQHAGWKVGLTNRSIQQQFQVHEPVMGFLLRSGQRASETVFRFHGLIRPGFENELCVTIGRTLAGPGVTRADAATAVTALAPAFEIIENRGDFVADLSLALADNSQQKAFVTGEVMPPPPGWQLTDTRVEVLINGRVVDRARGDEGVCDPLAAVAWLANKLAELGRRLEAGAQVMSGSFTRQYPLSHGDRIEARWEPFGAVRASFE